MQHLFSAAILPLPIANVKQEMRNSSPLVLYDAAWRARMARVLSGALHIWGVCGAVSADPDDASAFVIAPVAGPAVKVSHHAADGWVLRLHDRVSGTHVHLGSHAGLPGLLRRMREQLAPDSPSGRLVIGAQQILARDSGRR
jgi:hypothetical protein